MTCAHRCELDVPRRRTSHFEQAPLPRAHVERLTLAASHLPKWKTCELVFRTRPLLDALALPGFARLHGLMSSAQLREVNPIVGTRDVDRAIAFYVERLGFELAFDDPSRPRNYIGLRRDNVVLHFQFQDEHEMSAIRLRLRVTDPDALLAEFETRHAFAEEATPHEGDTPARVELTEPLEDQPWGNREFAFYDPDGNALFFYRPLE